MATEQKLLSEKKNKSGSSSADHLATYRHHIRKHLASVENKPSPRVASVMAHSRSARRVTGFTKGSQYSGAHEQAATSHKASHHMSLKLAKEAHSHSKHSGNPGDKHAAKAFHALAKYHKAEHEAAKKRQKSAPTHHPWHSYKTDQPWMRPNMYAKPRKPAKQEAVEDFMQPTIQNLICEATEILIDDKTRLQNWQMAKNLSHTARKAGEKARQAPTHLRKAEAHRNASDLHADAIKDYSKLRDQTGAKTARGRHATKMIQYHTTLQNKHKSLAAHHTKQWRAGEYKTKKAQS